MHEPLPPGEAPGRVSARAWATTLEIGRRGEAILDAVFGPAFIIVNATAHHQRQGLDRFFIHRRDGHVIYRVDYKCDEVAARTGNLALEHVSVVRKGRREAEGWIHTTVADLVISYVPGMELAFVMKINALREAFPVVLQQFPPRMVTTSGPQPYATLVCPVPIAWLREHGLITRTVNVRAAQLRLPLTVRRSR